VVPEPVEGRKKRGFYDNNKKVDKSYAGIRIIYKEEKNAISKS